MGKAQVVTSSQLATNSQLVTSSRVVPRAEVLAGRQGGLINRDQALAEGLTPRQVRTLLDHRRWERATRGVYLTPVDSYRNEFDTARARAAWMGLLAVPGQPPPDWQRWRCTRSQGSRCGSRPRSACRVESVSRGPAGLPSGVTSRRCRRGC